MVQVEYTHCTIYILYCIFLDQSLYCKTCTFADNWKGIMC